MKGILVIGYGNTLRRDDGVGALAAQAIAANNPDVHCLTTHELLPEHAEQIAQHETVIFIDGGLDHSTVTLSVCAPSELPVRDGTHLLSPSGLIQLSRDLYDHSPSSIMLIEIPVFDTSFGESLSPGTESAIHECVALVGRMLSPGQVTSNNSLHEIRVA